MYVFFFFYQALYGHIKTSTLVQFYFLWLFYDLGSKFLGCVQFLYILVKSVWILTIHILLVFPTISMAYIHSYSIAVVPWLLTENCKDCWTLPPSSSLAAMPSMLVSLLLILVPWLTTSSTHPSTLDCPCWEPPPPSLLSWVSHLLWPLVVCKLFQFGVGKWEFSSKGEGRV